MLSEQTAGRLAATFGAVAVLKTAGAVVVVLATGWSFHDAVDAYVVSNICIGLAFALCGAILAANQPRHPVGWL